MDERWRILRRVRDLRMRLAMNEVSRERRAQARAQAALEQARTRKTRLEEQATGAIGLLAGRSCVPGEVVFDAAQAQQLLDFAASARLQARAAAAPVRQAQLQCVRAQEGVAEASAKYRREAGRKKAVESRHDLNFVPGRQREHDRTGRGAGLLDRLARLNRGVEG